MSSELPPPPSDLRFGDVTLHFEFIKPGDPEQGFVPAYHFRIHDADGVDVGRIRFRVGDTPHVTICVGHIGYLVEEDYRGHGYAYMACRALEPFAFSVLDSILITVNPDNPASIRTIEKLGATFIDIQTVPEHDPHYASGARIKRRYRWERCGGDVE